MTESIPNIDNHRYSLDEIRQMTDEQLREVEAWNAHEKMRTRAADELLKRKYRRPLRRA